MIVGTGIDMIEIARIEETIRLYGERFLRRIYLPAEIQYCLRKKNSGESFAARFAAKEAAAKALGTGIQSGVGWREIEVVREPSGRPSLQLHGRAGSVARRIGANRFLVSLTHSRSHAIAQVLLER